MVIDAKEKTALATSVGADERQSVQNTNNIIPIILYPLPMRNSITRTKILWKILKKSIVRCAAWQTRTICTQFL